MAKISNKVTKLLGTLKSKTQSLFKSKKRDTNVMSKQKQNFLYISNVTFY